MPRFTLRTALAITAAVAVGCGIYHQIGWQHIGSLVPVGSLAFGAWLFWRECLAVEDDRRGNG